MGCGGIGLLGGLERGAHQPKQLAISAAMLTGCHFRPGLIEQGGEGGAGVWVALEPDVDGRWITQQALSPLLGCMHASGFCAVLLAIAFQCLMDGIGVCFAHQPADELHLPTAPLARPNPAGEPDSVNHAFGDRQLQKPFVG